MNENFDNVSISDLETEIEKLYSKCKSLEETLNWYRDRVVWGFYENGTPMFYQGKDGEHEINDPVTAVFVNNLIKGFDIYKRERERFLHSNPELTGAYFLAGGYGNIDENKLPQYVRIVPAYGCAFEIIYEKTDKIITYEGS